jgi:hypothetical protein
MDRAVLRRALVSQITLGALWACATLGGLGGLVQMPRFERDERPAELRLFGLTRAGVRIHARVENPNAFALTLSTVRGTLLLDGREAADVDLPLGLPLQANEQTEFPIDVSVSLQRLPDLADVLARVATGSSVDYALDGTVGVDAGPLGTPTFGPLNLLRGEVQVRR